MSQGYSNDSMMDIFIFETSQLIEKLEESILTSEKSSCYTQTAINEIFRIMHTIKGSSAMMMLDNISTLAHSMEDLFYILREEKVHEYDCSTLSDIVFECIDFIKIEVEKLRNGDDADGDGQTLIANIKEFISSLKQGLSVSPSDNKKETADDTKQQYYISPEKAHSSIQKDLYKAVIVFEEGCGMENIHAFSVVHRLKNVAEILEYEPKDIFDNDGSADLIKKQGFKIIFKTDCKYDNIHEILMKTVFLKELELDKLESENELTKISKQDSISKGMEEDSRVTSAHQSIISVNVAKLDKLMDLVGEMVIAEAMVVQNPDLKGLELDNFQKAARQLNKITNEIQDMVMSIRMVSLSTTFHKMHRLVRDMCKKLGKKVELEIIGEDTEVDKNIIEHISDPLMHLVRNAIDHGIELPKDRAAKGKSEAGTITLEAKNAGSDVLIIVKDDGKGLSREKILRKAMDNKLILKPESDMTDKEVYNLIFLPGFSTKEDVSEFSGRGVGMDVVVKNIEAVGGSISIDSSPEKGTMITLKIPLTLAIIDGMNVRVGKSCYTIPTISIKESFRPKEENIITDPDGNEMIMVRGQCYPILRLHEIYNVKTDIKSFFEGIIVMVEQDGKYICIFADELLGQQQVVVKALPNYIKRFKKITGLAGCTLLGDGSISLILDIGGLTHLYQ